MNSENVGQGNVARNIRRAGCGFIGYSIIILVIIAAFVAALDYASVRSNQVGSGWRYASHLELEAALMACDVRERGIIRAGFIFKFGWAWNSFREEREMKSNCLDQALKRIGATAAIYDAVG